MTKARKPTSKRRSTKMAQGLKKKAAAHNRKQKKLAKKDITWKSRVKKDPGIPSAFPYKDRILSEMEDKKREDLEQKELRRQHRIDKIVASGKATEEEIEEELEGEDEEEKEAGSTRLSALLESAQMAADEQDDEDEESEDEEMEDDDEEIDIKIKSYDTSKENVRKVFEQIYEHVVEVSDVILYVLDSRDPEGTRSKDVEQALHANPEKRLLFVLNKADLISTNVAKKWQAYLGLSYPTLPFVASAPAPHAQTFAHNGLTQISSSTSLLKALKAYSAVMGKPITVGILGYPNVGKSSIINSLVARNSVSKQAPCVVASVAGTTTSIRPIKIDSKIKVIDTPGVVFAAAEKKGKKPIDDRARLALLHALPPKAINDAIAAASLLLKRLYKVPEFKDRLMATYNIPSLLSLSSPDLINDFLVHVARNKGRLNKGGVPDLESAAKAVLNDWRDGRVSGWTVPKATEAPKAKKSVAQWSEEFKLEALWIGSFGEEDTV